MALLLVGAAARALAYGDMRLSVGNAETPSYVVSSRAPLFSWDSFAGKRLFTTNLVYKLANDPRRCPLTAISNPAEGHEVSPAPQPCFGRITVLQGLLAIAGWILLAWTVSRWLRHPVARVGAAVTLLLFSFTPQIAEWDNVLSPESLSMSLLAIVLAILLELVFQIVINKQTPRSPLVQGLAAAWLVTFTLWMFIRDVHVYAIPITLALMTPLIFLGGAVHRRILAALAVLLLGLFVLGSVSARDSLRATRYPLTHAFKSTCFPIQAASSSSNAWACRQPPPPGIRRGWIKTPPEPMRPSCSRIRVSSSLPCGRSRASSARRSSSSIPTDTWNRESLLALGEIFHPETNAVFLIGLLLVGSVGIAGVRRSRPGLSAWAWVLAWFILSSAIILAASFFGDAEAYRRHLMPAVEAFRLLMWLAIWVVLDEFLAAAPSPYEPRVDPGVMPSESSPAKASASGN